MNEKIGKTVREYINSLSDDKWVEMIIQIGKATDGNSKEKAKEILLELLKMDGADFYELSVVLGFSEPLEDIDK